MEGSFGKLLAILAALGGALPAWASTLDPASANGINWLIQQRNTDYGSWGTSDAVKYVMARSNIT